MTRFYYLLFALLMSTALLAQSPPQSFSYQTVIRDAGFNIMSNQEVVLRLSILEDEPQGLMVYQEKHVETTSAIGLVNLFIGEGNLSSGSFDAIDWANHTYFLQVEIDFDSDDTFIIMGTSQLRSVPYALYALNAGNTDAGSVGPQGEQGIQGETGEQGLPGFPGTNGQDGNDGADGAQGETGAQGPIGLTGQQGIQGETGEQGLPGFPGINGQDGEDGLNGTQGVQGETGAQGPIGDTGLQGIQGIEGETGEQGLPGFPGINGQDGNDGVDGLNGTQGETGAQGPIGLTGLQGIQGIQGETGEQGLPGFPGINGVDGADGNDGAVGATGPAGANGIDGTNGVDGATGAIGLTGETGPQGNDGADGATGPIGLTGATGPAGANGIDGTNGVDGATGAIGLTGATGPPGNDGTNGTNGVDGYTPMFGVDYFNGQDGTNGVDGTNGADGIDAIVDYDSLANLISVDSTFITNVGGGMGGGEWEVIFEDFITPNNSPSIVKWGQASKDGFLYLMGKPSTFNNTFYVYTDENILDTTIYSGVLNMSKRNDIQWNSNNHYGSKLIPIKANSYWSMIIPDGHLLDLYFIPLESGGGGGSSSSAGSSSGTQSIFTSISTPHGIIEINGDTTYNFIVPENIFLLHIEAAGGNGGAGGSWSYGTCSGSYPGSGGSGGYGASFKGLLTCSQGDTITFIVGSSGISGNNATGWCSSGPTNGQSGSETKIMFGNEDIITLSEGSGGAPGNCYCAGYNGNVPTTGASGNHGSYSLGNLFNNSGLIIFETGTIGGGFIRIRY